MRSRNEIPCRDKVLRDYCLKNFTIQVTVQQEKGILKKILIEIYYFTIYKNFYKLYIDFSSIYKSNYKWKCN